MKKVSILLLILAILPLSSIHMYADTTDIDVQMGYVDPTYEDDQHRTSVPIPQIVIENYTLFFYTPCNGCTLRLLSSSGNVEYSTVIASGTTSLVLPSYLSGTYEIQIIQGSFYFWGYINL